MENPHEQLKELQDTQREIMAFIDKYTENADDDDLAHMLRRAIADLNDAKGIIWDRAVEAGIFNPTHHGNPEDDSDEDA
ncbi:MAG TPA: hypothetical protein VJZ27_11050, partial [Aggregatilineales bacterium]|nr:hypothetical protein [Aggregatilineales bacterium]